ncbi:BgtTE-56084 [Blumeria graminis f. sp. tritici]|uniref:BgtTE-56084 n=1 Tax=Blumeria graminis f. sp. tritici TaxID=62690 RepID=A0A9X9MJS5_BLUGR|nr:BgtTE-56084 [Blumeria graminis f. sp. tritici]
MFVLTTGLAGFMFIMGTEDVEWLDTWRQVKFYDSENRYVSLDVMMSTLRQMNKERHPQAGSHAQAAVINEKERAEDYNHEEQDIVAPPNDLCRICKNKRKHKNRNCFKQHPELKRKTQGHKNRWNKQAHRGSAKAVAHHDGLSDSDDSDDLSGNISLGTVASAAAKLSNRQLYDTGASHHFVKSKSHFNVLKELPKPFEFDQAVGKYH